MGSLSDLGGSQIQKGIGGVTVSEFFLPSPQAREEAFLIFSGTPTCSYICQAPHSGSPIRLPRGGTGFPNLVPCSRRSASLFQHVDGKVR